MSRTLTFSTCALLILTVLVLVPDTVGVPLEDTGLVVRYFLDEAAFGRRPAEALDAAPNSLNLRITYGGSPSQPVYREVETGRGLRWTQEAQDGRAEASTSGTKVMSMLDGSVTATIEIVVDAEAVSASRGLLRIGGGAIPNLGISFDNANRVIIGAKFSGTFRDNRFSLDLPAQGRVVLHAVIDTSKSANVRVLLYRDGSLIAANVLNNPNLNDVIQLENGQFNLGNRPFVSASMKGTIYYAAIYNVAFTQAQVSRNFDTLSANDDAETPPEGPPEEIVDRGAVVLYYFDEAASGQGPKLVYDHAPDPLHLYIDYKTSDPPQPVYKETATGRGLEWITLSTYGAVESEVRGTKLYDRLHGSAKVTYEFVVDITETAGLHEGIVHISDGSNGRLLTFEFGTGINVQRVMFNNIQVATYGISFGTEGRRVYHFVIDTTQATAEDRVRLYKDGTLQSKTSSNPPSQNASVDLSNAHMFTALNSEEWSRSIKGTIYYLAVYDTAFNESRVEDNRDALISDDDSVPTPHPLVLTKDADDNSNTSVRLRGELVKSGTASSVDVNFQWGTSKGNLNGETTPQKLPAPGPFEFTLTDLEKGKQYFFRARALGNDTAFGKVLSFVTTPVLPLQVHSSQRFLHKSNDDPFFALADTAWRLTRLRYNELDGYLDDVASKKYNLVLGPDIGGGYGTPGWRPDNAVGPGSLHARGDYAVVHTILEKARARGIYVMVTVNWGNHWQCFDVSGSPVCEREWTAAQTADVYNFTKDLSFELSNYSNVLWFVSGEYLYINDGTASEPPSEWITFLNHAGQGLKDGSGGNHLVSIHPGPTPSTSSAHFHNESWLDFNTLQAAAQKRNEPTYVMVKDDYGKTPTKPVWESEAIYEGTSFAGDCSGRATPWDIRRYAYWTVFAGGFGFGNGHNNIWQMARIGDPLNNSTYSCTDGFWYNSLDAPGRTQMQHLKALTLSRPYFSRITDQAIITSAEGGPLDRRQATRASDGSYAFVYLANGGDVTVDRAKISGTIKAWWYNPRDGTSSVAGDDLPNTGTQTFSAPSSGTNSDWVLVLDDKSRSFPAPGSEFQQPTPPGVATEPATDIAATSATLHGNLTDLGTAPSVDVSFSWGTDPNLETGTQETTPEARTVTGTFSAKPTNLDSQTTYYFRAKAVGHDTVLGDVLNFTTLPPQPPEVQTLSASDVTSASATIRGVLLSLGTASQVDVSFLWSLSAENLDQETTPETLTGEALFRASLSGLSPETTYYFRAKAVGDFTVFGDVLNFTTLALQPPEVQTLSASDVTSASATIRGVLLSLGTASQVDVSFLWGLSADNLDRETTPEAMTGDALFRASVSGLLPETTYHFRAKAVGHGTVFGDVLNFTTGSAPSGMSSVPERARDEDRHPIEELFSPLWHEFEGARQRVVNSTSPQRLRPSSAKVASEFYELTAAEIAACCGNSGLPHPPTCRWGTWLTKPLGCDVRNPS